MTSNKLRKISLNLVKLLLVIIILSVSFIIKINPAYANNNSFASGTLILTPKGNISVDNISRGDRVIGYNFDNHQQVINTVKNIKKKLPLAIT